jgi:1-acyl-sn-glycerol-3-phosphate acyltransferase
VRRLADQLAPDEGVFIYPEGTRFTPERRRRVLDRIRRQGGADLVARAERLRHVLPPRLGGTLALLDAETGADVVVCVHFGFDGIRSFKDLLGGGLIDRTIEVEFWRVPAALVPKGRDDQIDWLFEQWSRVDEWVGRRSGAASEPPRDAPSPG